MTESLEGKTVLVTGCSGRIGAELCKAIVDRQGCVVNLDVVAPSEEILKTISDSGRYLYVTGDTGEPAGIVHAINEAVQRFGQLDAAVHCAYPTSSQWGASFDELEPEALREDLYQQLGGAILFSQKVISFFRKQGWGNLIHVSSIQGISAPRFWHYEGTDMTSPIEYSAIKAGVIAITKYLAKLYFGQNLRVNCISPGGVLDDQPEEFLSRYRSSCNSKGMLDAHDLTGLFLFLLSDEAKYISGQNFVIDDGWSL